MARKSVPNYVKIHDALKDEVEKGIWKIGQRLPSERDLAERFTVSRMTARQAVTALVDEGILDRRVGSGTYVASRRVREKMRGTTSFTEIISSQGKVPSTEVLSYIRTAPNEVECEKLNITKKDSIIRMERIRYADNVPICYEVASIPFKLVKSFDKKEITSNFFKTLESHGHEIGRSEQIGVKKGDVLISFDMDEIKKAGYLCTTPMIVCNTDDYKSVTPMAEGTVQAGTLLLEVKG